MPASEGKRPADSELLTIWHSVDGQPFGLPLFYPRQRLYRLPQFLGISDSKYGRNAQPTALLMFCFPLLIGVKGRFRFVAHQGHPQLGKKFREVQNFDRKLPATFSDLVIHWPQQEIKTCPTIRYVRNTTPVWRDNT